MGLKETYMTDITNSYNTASWVLDSFIEPNKDWFAANYNIHPIFDQTWRDHIKSFVVDVYTALKYLIWCNSLGNNPERIPYYLEYFTGSDEFTMDVLLSTMLDASFEQLTSFMGITKAYEIAVWDAPFNEEYYAALARGFKEWGVY